MLSEIDGMLQSLYMLNNTRVPDARTLVIREMNGNPEDIREEKNRNPDENRQAMNGNPEENPQRTPLDFEVTVKSHKDITARDYRDKQKRGVGEVLSPVVGMTTGGVPKYSYSVPAKKNIQTYFRKKASIRDPFNLRVLYVGIEDEEEVESDLAIIPIKDEETEASFPVQFPNNSKDIEGWNIYLHERLILQIRFHL